METGVPFFLTESSYNAIIKHDWRTSMIVLGYKAGTNFTDVAGALKKHTNMDAKTVKKVVLDIQEGKGVTLPDDFVLREDLVDLKLIVG